MNRRIIIKRGAATKAYYAEMKKLNKKYAKIAAKEAIEGRLTYFDEVEEERKIALRKAVPDTSFIQFYNSNHTPMYRHIAKHEKGDKYTIEELVDIYNGSMASGEPSLSLTNPQQRYFCLCTKKYTKTVTLYMMSAHVERNVSYCGCQTLFEALFSMQFLPSSEKNPGAAVHIALLNHFHVKKTAENTSFHGFAQNANIVNEIDKPLTEYLLSNTYTLYRRIIDHSTDSENVTAT